MKKQGVKSSVADRCRNPAALEKKCKKPLDKPHKAWYNKYIKRSSKGYLHKSPIPWGGCHSAIHEPKAQDPTCKGVGESREKQKWQKKLKKHLTNRTESAIINTQG